MKKNLIILVIVISCINYNIKCAEKMPYKFTADMPSGATCTKLSSEDLQHKFVLGKRFVPTRIYGSPLHKAIENNNVPECEKLIADGADLNLQDHFNRTPINLAISHKNPAICKLLANRDVELYTKIEDQFNNPWSAITQAFLSDNEEIRELFAQRYLRDHESKIDRQLLDTPFVKSLASGSKDQIDLFLPEFKSRESIMTHAEGGDTDGMCFYASDDLEALDAHNKALRESKKREFGALFPEAVFAAVMARNFDAVKRLIDYKAI